MPDVYATADDVADRWRPLAPEERRKAQVLAEDASYRVRRRFPTLDARITRGDIDRREVTAVVAGMVKRALLGGGAEGVSQQTEARGPFSTTVQFATPVGTLAFTEDDLAALAEPTTGAGRRRAFSVDLSQRA